MNSSPRLSPRPAASDAAGVLPASAPFPYFSIAGVPGSAGAAGDGLLFSAESTSADSDLQREQRQKTERAAVFEEGRAEARKTFDEQLARERAAIAEALAHFSRERVHYFEKVEGEVVQLALSIAAKIMHREAQLDPLLLAAMVRVALEKIERGTGVVLRVHPQKAAEWQRYFAISMRAEDVPEILEDAAQDPEQCVLQTSMGTATVGLEAQLKEIERGLMDILAAAPSEPAMRNTA
jgi:flagellar assembly protein FliH